MFPLHPQEHDQPADFLTAAMKFSRFSSQEICLLFYHTLFLFLCYLPSVKNNVWKDSTLLFLFSSWKSGWPCDFPPKTPQVAWSVIPVNWIILRWYACGADGRSNVRSCDTKISRMDILPSFVRYGAMRTRVEVRYKVVPQDANQRKSWIFAFGPCFLSSLDAPSGCSKSSKRKMVALRHYQPPPPTPSLKKISSNKSTLGLLPHWFYFVWQNNRYFCLKAFRTGWNWYCFSMYVRMQQITFYHLQILQKLSGERDNRNPYVEVAINVQQEYALTL